MIKSTVAAVLLMTLSHSAHADWALDKANSTLSFVSVKKSDVMEAHHFNHINGTLTDNGAFSLVIDLSSVDTAIAIRDSRMGEHLFETNKFPQATLSASIPSKALAGLVVNQTAMMKVPASLNLHGEKQAMNADVSVTLLSDGNLLVSSNKPVFVNAGDFNLIKGIEKLRELAGLPSISTTVPVTFSLRLNNQ
ncbi:MAG: hypothetical protein BM565_03190 [Gammaproteobacteria bacterium MedPE]|nr:MAG: hypothetical protein BM565_03190 [Gammaproteobacteria bacterium MedPE]